MFHVGPINSKTGLTIRINVHCTLQSQHITCATQRRTRLLNAASGGSALERCCAQEVEAAGDRITTLLSLRAGAAPGRQLSRWSACSKLSPPLKRQPGPSSVLLSSRRRRCLARLAESTLCAKLEAFCTTVSQRKHADKDP